MEAQKTKKTSVLHIREAIFGGLSYIEHLRLMTLLVCLALALGLSFFVFSRAVYQSRALVRFEILNLPFSSTSRGWEATRRLNDFLNSKFMVERTAQRLKLTNGLGNYETLRDTLVPKVEVGIVDASNLRIDVFAYKPELIKVWQPALIEEYKEYQQKLTRERRERYLQLYKEQLSVLGNRINEKNDAKSSFEEENAVTELFVKQSGITQVPREMILTRHQLSIMDGLKEKLADPRLVVLEKLSLLSTVDRELKVQIGSVVPDSAPRQGGPPGTLESLVPSSGDPGRTVVVMPGMVNGLEPWQELDKEQRKLLQTLHEAEKTYLPGHAKIIGLKAELSRVADALTNELAVMTTRFELEHARLKEKLASLEKQLPDYREVTKKYQSFRDQFRMQEEGQLAWDKAYTELARQIATTEFKGDQQPIDLEFSGFTLMREDPVSPPKMKLLLLSVVLGLGLAVGVPFGLEKLNDTVSRLEDAEDALNTPALGVIPVYERADLEQMNRGAEIDAEKPDRLFENFRLIRASLALNRLRTGSTQAILVSSARPREGKTTMALNLAWSFASMGERTLLVDCDLRRGRIHHLAETDNSRGLSDVLKEKAPWEDMVRTSTISNLDILTRGPIRNGAPEMLCRQEFADLMTEWRGRYARIVLDTPPLLGLSEPSSLQRLVDGTVLVILAESTPIKDAAQALDIVRKSGGNIFGFVLNRLDLRKAKNYYNYYYYSPNYYASLEGGQAS